MDFVVEARPYDSPEVTRMVDEVQAEYVERYGGPDAARMDAREFAPPQGAFFVGLLDGVAVAMGGWRRVAIDPDAGEVKRMYVSRTARRRGLARRLLAELERSAADSGLHRLVLNTGDEQPEAVALYAAAGYAPASPFGHYAAYPKAVFLAKSLTPVATPGA